MVWLLLPSGSSILFGGRSADAPRQDPVAARREAVAKALAGTRHELDRRAVEGLFEQALRPAVSRGDDPVVYALPSTPPSARRAIEAHAAMLWNRLPTRDPAVQTVIDVSGLWARPSVLPSGRNGEQPCLATVRWSEDNATQVYRMGFAVGGCALRERFGVPGGAWDQWLRANPEIPYDLDRGPPGRFASTDELATPWFLGSGREVRFWSTWSPPSRLLVSCASGNAMMCEGAFGVAGIDTSDFNDRSVRIWVGRVALDTRSTLPGALYRDLGAERFAELWHTDTTIAAAYEQIRGKPIHGVLQRLAFSIVGAQPRDNGLSPLAWVGALVWLALLGAWAALRLRTRTI
jgi:hypothetical protein